MSKVWEGVFSAVYDPLLWVGERTGMAQRRAELLRRAKGQVLELGAGTGLNLPHYPDGLEELVLTEPAPPMAARLERRAKRSGTPSSVMAADAERLPSRTTASTPWSRRWSSARSTNREAIDEIAKVLRPGGKLLFLEHVRSDSRRLARWQDRLHRPWHAFAAGCNANRATVDMLRDSELRVETVERDRWRWMPALVHPLAIGIAAA